MPNVNGSSCNIYKALFHPIIIWNAMHYLVEISDFLENIIPTPKDHQAEPS